MNSPWNILSLVQAISPILGWQHLKCYDTLEVGTAWPPLIQASGVSRYKNFRTLVTHSPLDWALYSGSAPSEQMHAPMPSLLKVWS